MDIVLLPSEWQTAFQRDTTERPPGPDPVPERKLARMLAAFVASGLLFMVLPGTVLGVWNLVGISSEGMLYPVKTIDVRHHAETGEVAT